MERADEPCPLEHADAMLLCTCNNLKKQKTDKDYAQYLFVSFFFNAAQNLRPVLTLLCPAAVGLRAGVGRSFGILGQVVLPRPVEDVAPVLRESAYPLVLEAAHVIWDTCTDKKPSPTE